MAARVSSLCLSLWLLGLGLSNPSLAATAVPFIVNTSEAVTVNTAGGTPRLALDVGGVARYADYTSGSGSSALTFTYTTQPGDIDLDGIAVSSPLDLNGGTIVDTSGNALSPLTFSVPSTSGVRVDHPSLSMNLIANDYVFNGTRYNSLSSFLTASGGSFTRASDATYFDSTGTMQTATSGVPRLGYDPSTLAARGLLIEESRANRIRNSTMAGGGPGVDPTFWSYYIGNNNSVTFTVVGIGTEDGIPYVDARMSGMTGTGTYIQLHPEQNLIIPATTGQTWTFSTYARISAGTAGHLINRNMVIFETTNTATYVTGGQQAFTATTAGLRTQRRVFTRTFSGGGTVARTLPFYQLFLANNTAVDVTIRIGAPQMELGATPTTFIPTSNAAVTRNADSLTIPTGAWHNATQGTLMANAWLPYKGAGNYPGLANLTDGTTSGQNDISLFFADCCGDNKNAEIWSGGVQTLNGVTGGVYAGNTALKIGVAYQANNAIAAYDGVLSAQDTTVTLPSIVRLALGRGRGEGAPANGWISQVTYYPVRIDSGQLQLLTQ